jgi:hypothetical protein
MNEIAFMENIREYIKRPSEAYKMIVDKIRHVRMDNVKFNQEDNEIYFRVFQEVMENIAKDYPELVNEVKRQIAKKKRWQERRKERNKK